MIVGRKEVILYITIRNQLVINSINRNKKQLSLNINNSLLQSNAKNHRCQYDRSLYTEKKEFNPNKKQIYCFPRNFFFFCVFASCQLLLLITRSFVHYPQGIY